ncbi:MAE_28990/MAE_18760 family HEPN-like nuclease [Amycolatopsis roodepoortensis]|uniref:MAE_28990/MAE_18760 family HEPN-like nuclease n=1 Tax=Amycolatopsis roodepoortensis TaxID=700274 RepID=UPI00214CBFE2|nr:MAE_28990/MAE_18760 family HEPN-like nuclease [Amycolatopsis roodepoortensis]UUV35789.1 MAE_28990/MAE_18760 family HEPN-like nuclease [Amycolatopsis roodepoortensis]
MRTALEEDLAWRLDELRHLRNELLGRREPDDWPASALRAILVMQYAHLEGFARNAFSLYVSAINSRSLQSDEVHPQLAASSLIAEFDALRLGNVPEQESESGRLSRRARQQVEFIEKMRDAYRSPVNIDADAAVSMEMNFGSDVLRRTLYRLAIPDDKVDKSYYSSLEFVRNARNDIAHGSRKERIAAGLFEAHRKKCENFMNDLARLITSAVREEWFRVVEAAS